MKGNADSEPVTRDLLVEWFETQVPRPRSIGLEVEYGLVRPGTGLPVRYEEPNGQAALLRLIERRLGGEPVFDGPALIGITLSDGASISLEASSAIEYSGVPAPSVSAAIAAARACFLQLAELAAKLGLSLLTGGYLPFGGDSISWVPKPRIATMLDYFRGLGPDGRSAAQVMGRSLSTQVTLDAVDVPEYLEKLRTSLLVSPYLAALMVNSPDLSPETGPGRPVASTRMRNWRTIDPARCHQLTLDMLDAGSIPDLVDALAAVPMIFRMTPDGPVPAPPGTFADLMAGSGPAAPTLADWSWHLSQVWPAVRPRHTLETRLPDGQSWSDFAVGPALWAGLMYDPDIRKRAAEITAASESTHEQLTLAAMDGVSALPPTDREICAELVGLSRSGLGASVERGQESADLLVAADVAATIAHSGRTPADRLRSQWTCEWQRQPEAYVQAMSVPHGLSSTTHSRRPRQQTESARRTETP